MLTLTLATLIVLALASVASAHRPGLHTAGTLEAPLLHWLGSTRQETNAVARSKCRARPYRAVKPARLVPEFARRFTIRVELTRLSAYRLLKSACVPWYITKQIRVANLIGQASAGDPWPNCPDPFDGGGYTWTDTVACENGGNWLDSPGYYRCGLQFDPMWERIYGRLCP